MALGPIFRKNIRKFIRPIWLGKEPIKDKIILLYAEQGLGDIIQFCRYVPLVARLGAIVLFEVPARLFNLLRKIEGIRTIIKQGEAIPKYDFHCPLGSLPYIFKTEETNIPHPNKYLYAQDNITIQIKKQIEIINKDKRTIIGISWKTKAQATGRKRSIPLKTLIKAFNLSDVHFINLQYGHTNMEIQEARKKLGASILQFKSIDNQNNIDGLASLIEACDLIVTIDNTTAHLAGSLGKDTRVLLPYSADWRWLLNRTDSPWYDSIKLYRQEKIDDWESALKKLKFDLDVE